MCIYILNLLYFIFLDVKVGPSYGRTTMYGVLAADGLRVGVNCVGKALSKVNPGYQQARSSRATQSFNPVAYHASYFGQKFHIDQNEKNGYVRCDSHMCY